LVLNSRKFNNKENTEKGHVLTFDALLSLALALQKRLFFNISCVCPELVLIK